MSIRSSCSRVSFPLTASAEDEVEDDDEEWLSCLANVIEIDWSNPENELNKPGTTIGTKFSVMQIIRILS